MTENDSININDLLAKSFQPLEFDLEAILEEKLREYDLSRTKVCALLNIEKPTFDEIISGTAKQPSLINVIKIVRFLELDLNEALPGILKNQSKENIGSIDKAEKASFIAKNFDIKKLIKIGFFDDTDDINHLTARILSFFGFTTIAEYEKRLVAPLYSKTKRGFSDKMKTFWINSAYQCFKNINNPNEYDREGFKDILTKIKPYCQDVESGLLTVCKALYNVGVTVIVQNHLTLTQVRGGTFIVNKKPCIVLTDLNKRYTTIWETLIHESFHVLYDLDTIGANGYHLSGDADLYLIEEKAEGFSREYFCGYEDYKYIRPHIDNAYLVERFAKDKEIHRSFVYSSYRQFEQILNGNSYYAKFNEHFPSCSACIKDLSPISWREGSIQEIALSLKTIFEINI